MILRNIAFTPHQPFLENNPNYYQYRPQLGDPFYGVVWEVYQVDHLNVQKSLAFPDISADFMIFYSKNNMSCYLMSGTKDIRIMTDFNFFNDVEMIFGVRFCSGALGNLFDDVTTVGENVIDGKEALKNGDETMHRLFIAKTFQERWNILKEYLFKRLSTDYVVDPLISFVTNHIIEHQGRITIKDLEPLTGYSQRYLRKRIHEGIGVSIKTFCNLTQFQWSYHYSQQIDIHIKLTELAHQSGYYDQSHMNNCYKKLTGLLPRDAIVLYK